VDKKSETEKLPLMWVGGLQRIWRAVRRCNTRPGFPGHSVAKEELAGVVPYQRESGQGNGASKDRNQRRVPEVPNLRKMTSVQIDDLRVGPTVKSCTPTPTAPETPTNRSW